MSEPVKYCSCMEEVRQRLGVIQAVLNRSVTAGWELADTELVFLQLRKILELIAFGSLTANKAKYALAYEDFASHWNARRMLGYLEKVNQEFYPIPLEMPQLLASGVKHCERVADGFLTKDEFVKLYRLCGKILHARNPFTADDPVINIGYSVTEWVARIQSLLNLHLIRLVDGDVWVVEIHAADGKVHAYTASPQAVSA